MKPAVSRLSRLAVPLGILIVAVLARAWVAWPGFEGLTMGIAYTDDSPRYERLAMTMLEEGIYEAHALIRHQGLDRELYEGPEVFRVPGYPTFLATVYAVTGYSTKSALAVQVLLAALICVLVYWIGAEVHSPRLGMVAAVLLLLNPKPGVHAGQITSEVLFTFLLTLTTLLCVRLLRNPTLRSAVFGGFAFVMLALTRPLGLHLVLIFLAVGLFSLGWQRRAAYLAIPVLAVVLSLQAWSYRNYLHSGVWAVTSNDGFTLGLQYPAMIWANAHAKSYRDGELEVLHRHAEVNPQYAWVYRDADADPRDHHAWHVGLVHDLRLSESLKPVGYQMLVEEWPTTIKVMLQGSLWSYFSGLNEWRGWLLTREQYGHIFAALGYGKRKLMESRYSQAVRIVSAALGATPAPVLFVFALVGLLHVVLAVATVRGLPLLFAPEMPAAGALLVLWIFYLFATAAPTANSRYIAPLLPLLSITAAFGLVRCHPGKRLKESRLKSLLRCR